jgi:hypothetical protein
MLFVPSFCWKCSVFCAFGNELPFGRFHCQEVPFPLRVTWVHSKNGNGIMTLQSNLQPGLLGHLESNIARE